MIPLDIDEYILVQNPEQFVSVSGDSRNSIHVHKRRVTPYAANVHFSGQNNVLFLAEDCNLSGQISFLGNNSSARFNNSGTLNLSAALYDGDEVTVGANCTAYGLRIWAHGSRKISIGSDCLFSENIQIRTSDHHAIVDLLTGEVSNPSADVVIEDRVWVGEGARIGKGSHIGAGSIIAGSAFVNQRIPSAELWGGVPARRLRSQVSWTNSYAPTSEEIAHLQDQMTHTNGHL